MISEKSHENSISLDLELPADLAKLSDPELFLKNYENRLVILDEIQRMPDLFPILRALIDKNRHNGRFLILGSASPQLLKQSSESLAGRICYHELGPLALKEIKNENIEILQLWLRGGYPLSLLADNDDVSMQWREAFIQTYLERDIPHLGIRIPSTMLRRFWVMLAHLHGGAWNASQIAGSLGVSAPTARHYLDILADTFIIRQLSPFHSNIGKRLVKAPKVYIRDSGILHGLLGLSTYNALLNHPSIGASWEGWAIEQILSLIPKDFEAFFYRTLSGAEIDLVLVPRFPKNPIAVEIKFSSAPQLSRGFFEGFAELKCENGFIVYPGKDRYEMKKGIVVLPAAEIETIFS